MAHESPLAAVIKGGLAGLAGTAALTLAEQQGPRILEKFGVEMSGNGSEDSEEESSPSLAGKLAEKIAEGVMEMTIDEETQGVAGQAIHWSYGTAWGAAYGILQSSFRLPPLLSGLLLGGMVGIVASTVVPAMRVTPPLSEEPAPKVAMDLVLQLIYGVATAMAFQLLSRRND